MQRGSPSTHPHQLPTAGRPEPRLDPRSGAIASCTVARAPNFQRSVILACENPPHLWCAYPTDLCHGRLQAIAPVATVGTRTRLSTHTEAHLTHLVSCTASMFASESAYIRQQVGVRDPNRCSWHADDSDSCTPTDVCCPDCTFCIRRMSRQHAKLQSGLCAGHPLPASWPGTPPRRRLVLPVSPAGEHPRATHLDCSSGGQLANSADLRIVSHYRWEGPSSQTRFINEQDPEQLSLDELLRFPPDQLGQVGGGHDDGPAQTRQEPATLEVWLAEHMAVHCCRSLQVPFTAARANFTRSRTNSSAAGQLQHSSTCLLQLMSQPVCTMHHFCMLCHTKLVEVLHDCVQDDRSVFKCYALHGGEGTKVC